MSDSRESRSVAHTPLVVAATLPELAADVARHFPHHEAFVQGEQRMTFAELDRAAGRLAVTLRARGVRRGDVVAISMPSSIDYAVCFLAAAKLGAVTTGLNLRLGQREIDAITARCSPSLAIVDNAALRLDVEIAVEPTLDRGEVAAAMRDEAEELALPALDPADPVCIVWTSGTTGVPKGAWFDHRALRAAAGQSGILSGRFARRLLPLPFAHAAFMTRFWDQLAHVMCAVLLPGEWTARSMLQTLSCERVDIGQGVPTQWIKLLELTELDDTDLSALRLVSTGAARVPPELVNELRRRLGIEVIIRYSCTEVPIAMGTRPGDPPTTLSSTIGRPGRGVELVLRDDAGNDVADGETGIVHLRAPCQFRGYWRDPERTAEALSPNGWVATGDLGRLDADGNLVLIGRRTDMYIRGGYNVHPLEVENVLDSHPAVDRSAVIGVDAPTIGEIGVAYIVLREGAVQPPDDELRAWCRRSLADYKAPDRIEFVDALPLNAMLKVDRRALRGLAETSGRRR